MNNSFKEILNGAATKHKLLTEDAYEDADKSHNIEMMVDQFEKGIKRMIATRNVTTSGHYLVFNGIKRFMFKGEEFGWSGVYKDIIIFLRKGDGQHEGMFTYYHDDKHPDRTVGTIDLYIMDGKQWFTRRSLYKTLHRLLSDPNHVWADTLFHELVHAKQAEANNLSHRPIDSDEQYFNHPSEFDAFYKQLMRVYHKLLYFLVNDKMSPAQRILLDIHISRDFKKAVSDGLPASASSEGIWQFATEHRRNRIIVRLYKLHEAIFQEIDRINNEYGGPVLQEGIITSLGLTAPNDNSDAVPDIATDLGVSAVGYGMKKAAPLIAAGAVVAAPYIKQGASIVGKSIKDRAKAVKKIIPPLSKTPTAIKNIGQPVATMASKTAGGLGSVTSKAGEIASLAGREFAPFAPAVKLTGRVLPPLATAWTAYDAGKYLKNAWDKHGSIPNAKPSELRPRHRPSVLPVAKSKFKPLVTDYYANESMKLHEGGVGVLNSPYFPMPTSKNPSDYSLGVTAPSTKPKPVANSTGIVDKLLNLPDIGTDAVAGAGGYALSKGTPPVVNAVKKIIPKNAAGAAVNATAKLGKQLGAVPAAKLASKGWGGSVTSKAGKIASLAGREFAPALKLAGPIGTAWTAYDAGKYLKNAWDKHSPIPNAKPSELRPRHRPSIGKSKFKPLVNDPHANESMNENKEDDQHQKELDKTGFWGSAGAGVIVLANDTHKILLPKRSEWVQEPATWGVWGGAIDSTENPQEAAVREFTEETEFNGNILNIRKLYTFKKDDFIYTTFLLTVDHEFEPTLNWETSEFVWTDVGKWPSPLHFGLSDIINDSNALNTLVAASTNEGKLNET